MTQRRRNTPTASGPERLQKILARAGFGSRRSAETLIAAGRVRVNGVVATLGAKADPAHDEIRVDGEPIRLPRGARRYVAVYKPRGVLSDQRSRGERRTVFDLVPDSAGLYSVGRLDLDSEGLILLTDDGELALRLTHPRYRHEKMYDVLVTGRPDEQTLERWRQGIMLIDPEGVEAPHQTLPAQVLSRSSTEHGTWLRIVMREGRKRQIRRVAQALGHPALRIIRTRLGPIQLGRLKPGEWRALSPEEIRVLAKVRTAEPARRPGTKRRP